MAALGASVDREAPHAAPVVDRRPARNDPPRRRLRPPLTVVLATVMFGCTLVLWSLVTPVSEVTDETTHADLVFHLAEGGAYPDHDGRVVGTAVEGVRRVDTWRSNMTLVAEDAPPASDRATFDELGGDSPARPELRNQMPQHPPLYYELAAGVVRLERGVTGGGWSLEREWLLVRLLGVALVLPLPLLCWATARRLGSGSLVARAAALVPLGIPQLGHGSAAITNDGLGVLLGGVMAWLLAGVLTGDASRRTAVVVGTVGGVGLLSKASGVALVVWALVVYACAWWRSRSARRDWIEAGALSSAVAAVVGGWWYVTRWLSTGSPTPSIEGDTYPVRPGFQPDAVRWGRVAVEWLAERFWGTFGWLTLPIDGPAVTGATLVVVVALLAAFVGRSESRRAADPPIGRARLAAFVSVLPVLLLLVLQRAWSFYARSGYAVSLQGRYLFPGIVALAVVVAIGAARLVGRWAPVVILAGATLMSLVGWKVALRSWWGPPRSSVVESLRAVDAWNPIAPGVGWAALVATLAVVVALVLSVARDLRTDGSFVGRTDLERPPDQPRGVGAGR